MERPLRDAVLAAPLADRPRLACADAVEHDDPARAELIRLQVEIRRHGPPGPGLLRRLEERQFRELELLDEHGPRWAGPLAAVAHAVEFGRGFVEGLTVDAAALPDIDDALLRDEPLVALRLLDRDAAGLDRALGCPVMGRLLALDLRAAGIDDDGAERIAACDRLASLVRLDLDDNPALGPRGVRALAASPHLRDLQWLGLKGSGANATPRPDPVDHAGRIRGWRTPALQKALRAESGPRPWMECAAEWQHNVPPAWWHLVDAGSDLPPLATLRLDARRVFGRVRDQGIGRAPLLVAEGQRRTGPSPVCRVGVFRRDGDALRLILDAWVPCGETDEVHDRLLALAPAVRGRWDGVFDMQWARAWTAAPAPLELWTAAGTRLRVADDALLRSDGAPVPLNDLTAVECSVTDDWSAVCIAARTRGGAREPLLSVANPGAAVDPTYDRLNLDDDVRDTVALATEIAERLGVPFEDRTRPRRVWTEPPLTAPPGAPPEAVGRAIRALFERSREGAARVLETHAPLPSDLLAHPRWRRFTLHLDPRLDWPALLATPSPPFEVNFATLSRNEGGWWSADLLDEHADRWDWATLSRNPALPWSEAFIERFAGRWDWLALSVNPALPWSPGLIGRFEDRWVFSRLAANAGVPWDGALVSRYLARIAEPDPQWEPWMASERPEGVAPGIQHGADGLFHLQQNPHVAWAEVLDLLPAPDWHLLSANAGVPWSARLLASHADVVAWDRLSANQGLPWDVDLLDRFEGRWSPSALVRNPALPWSEQLLERLASPPRWRSLSLNHGIPWTEELIERHAADLEWGANGLSKAGRVPAAVIRRYPDRFDWNWGLPTNRYLAWTLELVAEHRKRWNWERLAYNTALPWSPEFVAALADAWILRSFDRHARAWDAVRDHLDLAFLRKWSRSGP